MWLRRKLHAFVRSSAACGSLQSGFLGTVGWWVLGGLALCGECARIDDPYFNWDGVVRGMLVGVKFAFGASLITSVPAIAVIVLWHRVVRWQDWRSGRTPRDTGPLSVFLCSSWLCIPFLVPWAFVAAVSHGLDEMLEMPYPNSNVPVWALMIQAVVPPWPFTYAIVIALAVLWACVFASLPPIHASVSDSRSCPSCGYSREGLGAGAACPEFGRAAASLFVVPRPDWFEALVNRRWVLTLALVAGVLMAIELHLGEASVWVYRFATNHLWNVVNPIELQLLAFISLTGCAWVLWPRGDFQQRMQMLVLLQLVAICMALIVSASAHLIAAAGGMDMRMYRQKVADFESFLWLAAWAVAIAIWYTHAVPRWREDLSNDPQRDKPSDVLPSSNDSGPSPS